MGGLYFMADCQQKRKPVCSVCRDALAVYMLLFSWTHCFPPTTLQTCNNRCGCLPLHEHVRHLLKFVKGSSRPLNAPLSPPVFSVHPPLSPPLPLAAVVIGYDTGSTGRERGRIWMRRLSSPSLLHSNLLPCSFPALAHRCYRSNICETASSTLPPPPCHFFY